MEFRDRRERKKRFGNNRFITILADVRIPTFDEVYNF